MNPSNIAFSVCIPAYNARQWITETLESVRGQSHPHWEIIVVDDASPEPCRDLVEAFAATVPQRVVYHANATNLMTPHTRDVAHGLARYDYIAPLDCDDLWKPAHLAEFAAIFAREDSDMVFTSTICFKANIEHVTAIYAPSPEALKDLRLAYVLCQYWLQPSSLAFNRRLLERHGRWSQDIEIKRNDLRGFREVGEDRNFFLRMIKAGVVPRWTGTASTYYRHHEKSQRSRATHIPLARACLAHHHGLMPGLPVKPQRVMIARLCANGARSLHGERPHTRLAARYYLRAWVWWPWRIDRLVRAGLLSLQNAIRR